MQLSANRALEIGYLGERFVAGFFKTEGSTVEWLECKFDGSGDLIIDRVLTEVKTQIPFNNCVPPGGTRDDSCRVFTIPVTKKGGDTHSNQTSKCLNVPRLLFLSRPDDYGNNTVCLYEAPPVGKRFGFNIKLQDGRTVYALKISDMTKIAEFSKEDNNIVDLLR